MIQPTHLDEVRTVSLCGFPWKNHNLLLSPQGDSTNPLTWHHINLHSCSTTWEIHAILLSLNKCLGELRTKQAEDKLLNAHEDNYREGECQKQTAYLHHFNTQLSNSKVLFGRYVTRGLVNSIPASLSLLHFQGHILLRGEQSRNSHSIIWLFCVWFCGLSGWIWPLWTSSQRGFSLLQDVHPFKGQHTKLDTTADAGKKAVAGK